MKFKLIAVAALAGAVVVPQAASAQEYGPDDSTSIDVIQQVPETKEQAESEADVPLSWDFRLTNELHAYNNLDFLPLNEDTPQDILDTDDRQNFGYTSLAAGASYDLLEDTTINFGAALSGMWGNDQIGTSTAFGGFAYIYDLNVDWTPVDTDAFALSTTIGRQGYSIGGAREDYFFKDIVDGVTLNADFGQVGRLRLMFDIYGDAGRPDDVNFLEYISANKQTTNNFRGDTDVYRYGGVYELVDIIQGLDARVFGYGSNIGAARASQVDSETTTGADISNQGVLGNYSDQDYTWMVGGRANYDWEAPTLAFGVMGEYAHSMGIDRKARRLGLYDVNADGNAFGAGAHVRADVAAKFSVEGRFRFFRADGGQYTTEEGLQYSHGFVSMKGSQIGGINMDRYAGWHPSAYVSGFNGMTENPQDTSRKAGTMMLHGGLGFIFNERIRLDLDGWYFQDTSDTNFDVSRANEVAQDIEFGWSQSDLEAEARLGKSLGTELDAALTFNANEALSLYAIGGLFMPGEFYNTRIDRSAGTALGAPDSNPDLLENFWVASAGATLAF